MLATGLPRAEAPSARGELRVLLGAAPGVGKTYAMLAEGRRRAERGTDVVVGLVETHGRTQTAAQIDGLEVLPRRRLAYRGRTFEELDVAAVLARHPDVTLVDELAHTNVPGSRNRRRSDDIEELLAAGIDVITTVNVQHLASLNDVVEAITGIQQRETVPDAVVRAADQVELVDMTPEALRRRIVHGNVYPPSRADEALRNYFRPGNLAALRELALLWLADRVDVSLGEYRRDHRIGAVWPTRDRVVVALSGSPEGAVLIRRAARVASKGVGGELHAVYVARTDGLVHRDADQLQRQQRLVDDLSGTFHTLIGDDPAEAVLSYARGVNATSIVVGQSRHRRWQRLLRASVSTRIVRGSGDIDCHIVTHDWVGAGDAPARAPLSRRRRVVGAICALGLPALLTWLLTTVPGVLDHQIALLPFLAAVVAVALIGGLGPAILAAVTTVLTMNYFLFPPRYSLVIADPYVVVGLVIFLVVGVAVALVVDRAARRARVAAEARAEADLLLALTQDSLGPDASVTSVLSRVLDSFGQHAVELRARDSATGPWRVEAAAGAAGGETADTELALDEHRAFALYGRGLTITEQRLLTAFGAQVVVQLERRQLARAAARADQLADRNAFTTALLAAVSHDLRTPLAAIKAGLDGLSATDVALDEHDRDELLALARGSTDRLSALIANLLDLTRLHSTELAVTLRPVLLDEVLRAALIGAEPGRVTVAETDRAVLTDAGLAERVVANIVDNAVRHQPPDRPVRVAVEPAAADRIAVWVCDDGPGVPPMARQQMFEPFQRLGDAPAGTGLGLGLAVAAGFARALDVSLRAQDTPGGGLTMIIDFPAAPDA